MKELTVLILSALVGFVLAYFIKLNIEDAETSVLPALGFIPTFAFIIWYFAIKKKE